MRKKHDNVKAEERGSSTVRTTPVHERVALTHVEFARHVHESHETIRNRERGKRVPPAPPATSLRILSKAPADPRFAC